MGLVLKSLGTGYCVFFQSSSYLPMSIDFKKVEILPQISFPFERGAKCGFMYFVVDNWG